MPQGSVNLLQRLNLTKVYNTTFFPCLQCRCRVIIATLATVSFFAQVLLLLLGLLLVADGGGGAFIRKFIFLAICLFSYCFVVLSSGLYRNAKQKSKFVSKRSARKANNVLLNVLNTILMMFLII